MVFQAQDFLLYGRHLEKSVGKVEEFKKYVFLTFSFQERMLLTRLPNWHQVNGCSECMTAGRKKGTTVTYDDYRTAAPRTNASVLYAAANEMEGFTGRTGKSERKNEVNEMFSTIYFLLLPPFCLCYRPFPCKGLWNIENNSQR